MRINIRNTGINKHKITAKPIPPITSITGSTLASSPSATTGLLTNNASASRIHFPRDCPRNCCAQRYAGVNYTKATGTAGGNPGPGPPQTLPKNRPVCTGLAVFPHPSDVFVRPALTPAHPDRASAGAPALSKSGSATPPKLPKNSPIRDNRVDRTPLRTVLHG